MFVYGKDWFFVNECVQFPPEWLIRNKCMNSNLKESKSGRRDELRH